MWFFRLLLPLIALSACTRARPAARADRGARSVELTARKGVFERRMLLTGEIDAVASAELKVPRVSAGRVTIRWLENDGAAVKAGAKIAELDNATFVTQLKERALVVSQAEIDLRRQEWQNS